MDNKSLDAAVAENAQFGSIIARDRTLPEARRCSFEVGRSLPRHLPTPRHVKSHVGTIAWLVRLARKYFTRKVSGRRSNRRSQNYTTRMSGVPRCLRLAGRRSLVLARCAQRVIPSRPVERSYRLQVDDEGDATGTVPPPRGSPRSMSAMRRAACSLFVRRGRCSQCWRF